ncbi:hypothetical protein L798_12351 [Zootermopsis nevadensis]|uniref:Uncharacterized protein n=1 Tax=Zootermopsis nevadensis TaxID=136037 RepID=A0A067QWH0_ZOONE|nr:hypothetical protein L798_12351 [Zootermopsis nevadensis]
MQARACAHTDKSRQRSSWGRSIILLFARRQEASELQMDKQQTRIQKAKYLYFETKYIINTINFSDLTYKLGKLKEKAMKLFMHRTKITRLNASKSTTAGLLNEGIFLSRVCERRNVSTVTTPRKRTTTRHRVLHTLARLATVNELTRHLVLACSICKDNFRYSTFQGHWYMAKT